MHAFTLANCELGVAGAATQIEGGHALHQLAPLGRGKPGRIKDGADTARAW